MCQLWVVEPWICDALFYFSICISLCDYVSITQHLKNYLKRRLFSKSYRENGKNLISDLQCWRSTCLLCHMLRMTADVWRPPPSLARE